MSLSRSNTPPVSITNITNTSTSTSTSTTTTAATMDMNNVAVASESSTISSTISASSTQSATTSTSNASSAASWECYECGFFNYDDSSHCQACFKKCLYCDDDESDYCDNFNVESQFLQTQRSRSRSTSHQSESASASHSHSHSHSHSNGNSHGHGHMHSDCASNCEDCEDCNSMSSCNNSNYKSSRSRTTARSIRSCMLDIISFINNNSIKYEDSKRIMIHNVSESMANENLGNTHLFGVFGDVKKIEIIRIKRSNNIKAEITFYSADSVVALMKLSSSYHNYKIFSHY